MLDRVGSPDDEWCVLFIETRTAFCTTTVRFYTIQFHQQRSLLHTSNNIYCLSSLSYRSIIEHHFSLVCNFLFYLHVIHMVQYLRFSCTAKDPGLLDLVALIPQFSSCTVLIICFRKPEITEDRQNGDNIRDKLMHSLNILNMYGRIRRPPLVLTRKKKAKRKRRLWNRKTRPKHNCTQS